MKKRYPKSPTPNKSGDLRFSRKNADSTPAEPSSVISQKAVKGFDFKPEILAPAGSYEALCAAISAGADAVYFGGGSHNARINAHNFTNDDIIRAIRLLHSYEKKAYITLNTLIYERETDEYLRFAELVANAGADALIVADLGGAAALRRHFPELELHASTQMSGHNVDAAVTLSKLGFSRMVCARETSAEDLRLLVKNSPIEIEAFVHGALCVCHSGQCLFSSIVGGRSGNRGECAQPCRLPYSVNGREAYPLSLKDLSLASHVSKLADMGVHSLKIEGRMKSPEYVFGVTKAFRTLIDCGRDASREELSSLAGIFSRGGFTDGYFEKKIDSSMLGIRSDGDKQSSKHSFAALNDNITSLEEKRIPVNMSAKITLDSPSELSLEADGINVTVTGETAERAVNAPLSYENIKKSLTKLGNTRFTLNNFTASLDEGVILPVSALNALRRKACDELETRLTEKKAFALDKYLPALPASQRTVGASARFYSKDQIPDSAKEFFDVIYLPLHRFDGECNGVVVPPVIFDSERETVKKMLLQAKKKGAKYALVGNIGAIGLVSELGFELHGDLRFNVYNAESVNAIEELGVKRIILSPELTLPQMRDVKGNVSSVVYGRLPLMLLEKCVIRDTDGCDKCNKNQAALVDRRGIRFPVLREWEHRNTVYNSVPVYMADKQSDLERANITDRHFIFSTESKEECERIINAYKRRLPPPQSEKIRRI